MKTTCALLALAFASVAVQAQTQSLKDASQQAVLSNPEILARWHAFEAASHERAGQAAAPICRAWI
ncbi:hypothetical protein LP420_05315 [Massilia sp. B-10]|nr:hypothetical protein LP420_05315 [Massilia sp. B-10]